MLYGAKAMQNVLNVYQKTLRSWTRNKGMTSEFEAFTFAIKNQNIATKCKSRTTETGYINHFPEYSSEEFLRPLIMTLFTFSKFPLAFVHYFLSISYDVIT